MHCGAMRAAIALSSLRDAFSADRLLRRKRP
jgi:hypothetical protein